MDSTTAEQLIKEIQEAFENVSRGEGTTLCEARAKDDYQDIETQQKARELDIDTHWRQIKKKKLEAYADAFSFLDSKGMRYYLAPFLLYDLQNPDSDFSVTDCALHCLMSRDWIPKFSIFNARQSAAIAHYLEALAFDKENLFGYRDDARTALCLYWGRFLEFPQTLEELKKNESEKIIRRQCFQQQFKKMKITVGIVLIAAFVLSLMIQVVFEKVLGWKATGVYYGVGLIWVLAIGLCVTCAARCFMEHNA